MVAVTLRNNEYEQATNMLALLLLASAVASEWVEIAQHEHRREPSRRTFDGPTTANSIYANNSATERPWHRSGLSRIPNFGNVKRVQLQLKEKDMFAVEESTKINEYGRHESFGPVRAPNLKIKEDFDNDKRESNVEDVMRHHFGKINDKSNTLHNPSQHFNLGNEKTPSKSRNGFRENIEVVEKNKFPEVRLSDNREHKTDVNDLRNPNIQRIQSVPNISKIVPVKTSKVETKHFKDRDKIDTNPSDRNTKINETYKTANKTLLEDVSKIPYSIKPLNRHIDEYNFDKDIDEQIKIKNATEFIQDSSIRQKDKDKIDQNENVIDNNSKSNTVEVIWKLMKMVTDNISKNTQRSFRSKISYLESLRNNIIANIEERIELAWPDDAGVRGARRRRAARGHVEFPSSESALMTISFLTFAVFLIKLVLQVIHTYKNKTMMVTPALVAAVGRAAAALRSSGRPTHH